MSLINDVLRDVEARRGSGKARAVDDKTMIVPPPKQLRWPPRWRLLMSVGAILLVLLVVLIVGVPGADKELSAPERALVDRRDESSMTPSVVLPASASPTLGADEAGDAPFTIIATIDLAEAPPVAQAPEPTPEPPTEPAIGQERAASSRVSRPEAAQQPLATLDRSEPDAAARGFVPLPSTDAAVILGGPSDVVARRSIQPTFARTAESAAEHHAQALRAIERGAQADGERSLRRALVIEPGHVPASTALAAILLQQGRVREISALLEDMAARDQLTPRLAAVRARLLVESGNEVAAIDTMARFSLSEHDAEGLSLLGSLRQRAGQHELAVEALAAALSRNELNGATWAGMAVSLEALGRRGDALAAWQHALGSGDLQPALGRYAEERRSTLEREGR